jgi:hypothetical protein
MTSPTITFHLNDDYSVEIKKYMGSYGEYYSVNGTNYDIHFPIEWVFQIPKTDNNCFGPEECNLCAEYGYYGGVFIGYCIHCAKHANYTRGNGMLYAGVEIDQAKADSLGIPIEYKDANSMWNVYMQTAELSKIGDESLLTKHISFFGHRKKIDSNEMERIFDFYGWLNSSNTIQYYISEEEEDIDIIDFHSVSSIDSEPKTLSLILPENTTL